MSLPGVFGTNLESIPAQIPYLHAQAAKVSYWEKRIRGSGFKVGLVWAGNPEHENDHIRSIVLNDLITLADIPGVQLFGLGVIGEYLGKIYTETKARPRYIIEKSINFFKK